MKYFPFILLIIAIFLESSAFAWPLVMGMLLLITAVYKEQWVMIVAFVSGIVLDILTFHFTGSSSLFFLITLELFFLYQRKFEIDSPIFVGISVFVASLLYGTLFIHRYVLPSAVLTAILICFVYVGLVVVKPTKKKILI